jgi:hypothetical protein
MSKSPYQQLVDDKELIVDKDSSSTRRPSPGESLMNLWRLEMVLLCGKPSEFHAFKTNITIINPSMPDYIAIINPSKKSITTEHHQP